MNIRNIQKSIDHLISARAHHVSRSMYHSEQVEYVESEILRLTKEVNCDESVMDAYMESVGAIKQ